MKHHQLRKCIAVDELIWNETKECAAISSEGNVSAYVRQALRNLNAAIKSNN